jgi:hypothetical protein
LGTRGFGVFGGEREKNGGRVRRDVKMGGVADGHREEIRRVRSRGQVVITTERVVRIRECKNGVRRWKGAVHRKKTHRAGEKGGADM